ncbi:alpha/beta hydrolase-fold protein [Candidatus Neomarinimicrobiota bacterium]
MKLKYLLLVVILNSFCFAQDKERIVIGEKVSIYSNVLEKEMRLSIHIPNDYKNTNISYPVLYTFQTHFEQVAGAIKNLYDYKLTPKIICVKLDDYKFGYLSPIEFENDPNSGQANKFLKFFNEELFPYMRSNYRVNDYRIIFSNSWGGAFIVYSILTHPKLFQSGIASIPWVNYGDRDRYIINNAARIINSTTYYNNYLYMTMDNESILLPDLEHFIDILNNNPKSGLAWEYHHWPEEDHTSTPYRSIYSGLRTLYGDWYQIPDDIANKGLKEIKRYELMLHKKFGYDIGVSAIALRQAGNKLKRENKYDEAFEIFNYEIQKNPNDAFAYVALGRAYEENNQLSFAKSAFEEAYQIAVSSSHPQVLWVKNFLDSITQKIDSTNK